MAATKFADPMSTCYTFRRSVLLVVDELCQLVGRLLDFCVLQDSYENGTRTAFWDGRSQYEKTSSESVKCSSLRIVVYGGTPNASYEASKLQVPRQ